MNYHNINPVLVLILAFLIICLLPIRGSSGSADDDYAIVNRAEQFYQELGLKNFDAVWQMLSTANKKREEQTQYAERLRKAAAQVSLETFIILQAKFLGQAKDYAQVNRRPTF